MYRDLGFKSTNGVLGQEYFPNMKSKPGSGVWPYIQWELHESIWILYPGSPVLAV